MIIFFQIIKALSSKYISLDIYRKMHIYILNTIIVNDKDKNISSKLVCIQLYMSHMHVEKFNHVTMFSLIN